MSSIEREIESLRGLSEDELLPVRTKIRHLEELKRKIEHRLVQLRQLLSLLEEDVLESPPEIDDSMAAAPMRKLTAKEQILTLLNGADKPLTRQEIVQRLADQGAKYAPGTVHLYLQQLIDSKQVVQGDAPPESSSRYVYGLRGRLQAFGHENG